MTNPPCSSGASGRSSRACRRSGSKAAPIPASMRAAKSASAAFGIVLQRVGNASARALALAIAPRDPPARRRTRGCAPASLRRFSPPPPAIAGSHALERARRGSVWSMAPSMSRDTARRELAGAMRDRLVEQRERVAHAAVRPRARAAAAPRLRRRSSPRRASSPGAAAIACGGICFRLNCRQRDSTVTGIFCGSVVARMNLTCSRRLLQRLQHRVERRLESMCTSSIMYTL